MKKNLLEIAGIISLVLGILACLTVVGIIVGIPLIIGGNKIKGMANMSDQEILENKDTILIWTIVFLLINQISGIILLIFYIDLDSIESKVNTKYDELEKAKKLYDDKVLSKEEYEKEKERILNK